MSNQFNTAQPPIVTMRADLNPLPPGVIGYECKHAFYSTTRNKQHDCLTVKLIEHRSDGSQEPVMEFIPDFKRSFWVTKQGHRNHTDKKEWEERSRLDRYTTTQCMLPNKIARVLGYSRLDESLRVLARSPYLYGCDITTPVLLKYHYKHKFPNCISPNRVAILDIETDMVHGTGKIIMLSISSKKDLVFVATRDAFKSIHEPESAIKAKFYELLGEHARKRKMNPPIIKLVDHDYECITTAVPYLHKWKPDILSGWNLDFDITRIIETLNRNNIDPATVFNDPGVPDSVKYFKYIQGAAQKVTADGDITPLHPADRWHTLENPASFVMIDYMCLYKKLRTAKGNEPDYKLDTILDKNLGVRKLKFTEAEQYEGSPKWHWFMQRKFPVEYGIYNMFDCIGVEELNDVTDDLSTAISVQIDHSEYSRFPSQPRRTCDDLHFVCLEKGLVMGTTSDRMVDENDKYVVSMRGWIVTLPSHQTADNGLDCLKGLPGHPTCIRKDTFDDDVEGAYPHGGILANVSKETTHWELSAIRGISEDVRRAMGVNMTAGTVNAIEICQDVFGFPDLPVLLEVFKMEHRALH